MPQQKDVYQLYQDVIKPLYFEIEAEGNQIPVELLFEIHAAFDHLRRFHLNGEDENECCKKAESHIKRGGLDAFKLKLKYFNRDVESLLSCGADLELIDNGVFLANFTSDRMEIHRLAKSARMAEANRDKSLAFDPWCETSLKIDQFREKYLSRHLSVNWARNKTFKFITKDIIRGVIIGLITGFLTGLGSAWIMANNQPLPDPRPSAISAPLAKGIPPLAPTTKK